MKKNNGLTITWMEETGEMTKEYWEWALARANWRKHQPTWAQEVIQTEPHESHWIHANKKDRRLIGGGG